LFFAGTANAVVIQLDPNDYAVGTDLSRVSNIVKLSTLDGGPVYSSPIYRPNEPLPDSLISTDGFGDNVFSSNPDSNPEWFGIILGGDEYEVLVD
jgi:hypothetical protein